MTSAKLPPKIQRTIVFNNRIITIEGLPNLPKLYSLDLSRNCLNDLKGLPKFPSLSNLYLNFNNLREITDFPEFDSLIILDLNHNQISDIHSLKNTDILYSLNISNNRIKNFPKFLLKYLIKMDEQEKEKNKPEVRGSEKVVISYEPFSEPIDVFDPFANFEGEGVNYFQQYRFYNNYFETPPPEILKKDLDTVKEYFSSLGTNPRPLNEVKLLFVGDGAVGKTSLIKAITGQKHDPQEPQTHGIKIQTWKPEDCGRDLKVHVWDFGGQEIMQNTHQFFLSLRSVYVIVVDNRREDKIDHWIKHIQSFGGNSPILIAMNKVDENPSFDLPRKQLKRKYGLADGIFHRVACGEKTQGIEEFKVALVNALVNVPFINSEWGDAWFQVREDLQELDKDFIPLESYHEICKRHGIEREDIQEVLLGFLHDLGVMLNFPEFELKGMQILKPQWATEGVYKIINSDILAENKGILHKKDLRPILKKKPKDLYSYPLHMHSYLLTLMKKFELCYELGEDRFMVPDLLPVQEPDFDVEEEQAIHFVLKYDYLPKSIIPRIHVKLHRKIKKGLAWRTGMVLEDAKLQSTAVIRADQDRAKIEIVVSGLQRKDFFATILFFFRELHGNFEKLEVEERIAVSREFDMTVGYQHLINMASKGVTTLYPEGADDPISVRELLGEITPDNEQHILDIAKDVALIKGLLLDDENIEDQLNKIFEFKIPLGLMQINADEAVKRVIGAFRKNRERNKGKD